jgi:flagellar hook-basal body complex protein FliE
MSNGIDAIRPNPLTPVAPASKPAAAESAPGGADSFANLLRSQLDKVSSLQSEADEQVQALVTGQSESMTDVFVAARKAEVAFSLLMEIRNKLVDAYDEIKNLRV